MSKFIVDITKNAKYQETVAKHSCSCDACGKVLGEHWPNSKGSISLSLPKHYKGAEASEDVIYAEDHNPMISKHVCSEACLFDHLKDRKDKFEANRAKEMNQ